MKHSQKAPTMKDVSIAAQVSLGTVSKVINGIPVGEAYRRKVVEAIDRLGYQVNNYADESDVFRRVSGSKYRFSIFRCAGESAESCLVEAELPDAALLYRLQWRVRTGIHSNGSAAQSRWNYRADV